MQDVRRGFHVLHVSAAGTFLAALLGVSFAARGQATAPAPSPVVAKGKAAGSLTVPCWGCPENEAWPVSFRTDLDLLAPLGTGKENAAIWFKDFAKPDGARFQEAEAAMKRRVDGPADLGKILPPNDPLLLEAEPWCDQATMRYYPDFFALRGFETQIPNLLVSLTFSKSWVARGMASPDPGKAMDDFRRAVRLGRLLRQEDVTVIADLVGLACIRVGTQGIYDLATRQGNTGPALAAAIVLGEHAPQRLRTAERITRVELTSHAKVSAAGETSLALTDKKLADIVAVATGDPDRRFRGEATLGLNIVRFLGTPAQQEKALSVLNQLASSKDSVLSTLAAWSRDTRPTKAYLADAMK